jgi:phthalate 4,5-dioxygenase reductase component
MQNSDPSHTAWLSLQVLSKKSIAQGIVAFELGLPDGGELPAFTAGAHIGVRTPSGAQRIYSLYNDPAERHRYCIAVKRDALGRGGSVSMADDVQIGQTLQVCASENAFALHPRAKKFVFIAGGIGITPIMALLSWWFAHATRAARLF